MGVLKDQWEKFSRDVIEQQMGKGHKSYESFKAVFYAGMYACHQAHLHVAETVDLDDPSTFFQAIKLRHSMEKDLKTYIDGIRKEAAKEETKEIIDKLMEE